VHLDHGLKGQGTANVEMSKKDYVKNNHFPYIDLHITAGEVGQERTRFLLGPNADRAVMVGYPKADHLLKFNTPENKKSVLDELGFSDDLPLITYAPAGTCSYEKPGGSLCPALIEVFRRIRQNKDYNILLKYKQAKVPILIRGFKKLRRFLKI